MTTTTGQDTQLKTFEFFIDDLKDEAKERFISFLGGDNGNHDIIPFCVYETAVSDLDD
jgi:hypothetical protein